MKDCLTWLSRISVVGVFFFGGGYPCTTHAILGCGVAGAGRKRHRLLFCSTFSVRMCLWRYIAECVVRPGTYTREGRLELGLDRCTDPTAPGAFIYELLLFFPARNPCYLVATRATYTGVKSSDGICRMRDSVRIDRQQGPFGYRLRSHRVTRETPAGG